MCWFEMQVLVAGHFTHLPARIAGPRGKRDPLTGASAPAALLRCTCKVPSCSCGKHSPQHICAAVITEAAPIVGSSSRSCGMSHADCRTRRNHHGKHSPQHICAAVITEAHGARLPALPRSCITAKIRWESRPFNAHLALKVVISGHFALRCSTFLTLFVSAGICSDESRDFPSNSLSSHDFRSKRS